MRGYKWHTIVFLLILVMIQPYLMEWFSVRGVSISFVLFFTMMTAIGIRMPDVLIVPAVTGFVYDMMYSPWFGRMTVVLVLGTLAVIAVRRFVYKENIPVLIAFFFISTYLLENIRTMIELGLVLYKDHFMMIQGTILGISVYAGLLAAVFAIIYFILSLTSDRKLRTGRSGRA